jgi:hypothetical protein
VKKNCQSAPFDELVMIPTNPNIFIKPFRWKKKFDPVVMALISAKETAGNRELIWILSQDGCEGRA